MRCASSWFVGCAIVALSAGLGGCAGSGRSGSCGLPNAIVGYLYAPLAPGAVPPSGSITDPLQRSVLIVYGAAVPSGFAPVANAEVNLVGTTLNVRTGTTGLFSFAGIAAGGYTVRVTAEGHEPLEFAASVCQQDTRYYDSSYGNGTSSPGGYSDSSSSSDSSNSSDDGASSSGGDESSSSQSRVLRNEGASRTAISAPTSLPTTRATSPRPARSSGR